MEQVGMREAKTRLSRPVERAQAGEEIVIACRPAGSVVVSRDEAFRAYGVPLTG